MTIFVIILVGVLIVCFLGRSNEIDNIIIDHLERYGRLMAQAYQQDESQIISRWKEVFKGGGFPTVITDDGGHLTVTCTEDKASFQLIELIEPDYVKHFHKAVCKQETELQEKYGKGIHSCFKQVCKEDEPVLGLSYYKYQINIDIPSLTDEDVLNILKMQRMVTQQHAFPSAVREVKIRYHDKTYEARYESATARELFEIDVNGERNPLPINAKTEQVLLFLDELDASAEVEEVMVRNAIVHTKGETKKDALRQLKHIIAARDKYISERGEFMSFARNANLIYGKKNKLVRRFVLLAVLSFMFSCFLLFVAESLLGGWLMLLAVVLLIAGLICRPSQADTRSSTMDYLKYKNYPEEDEEVAFRAFSGVKTYSDLPQIKNLMAGGLVSKIDFEDIDIDIDMDGDSDFDFDD